MLKLKICNDFSSYQKDKENLFFHFSYPLFGPFGATMGKTIPTTPKIAVKIITGSAPMT
jgi:hypothetical protein